MSILISSLGNGAVVGVVELDLDSYTIGDTINFPVATLISADIATLPPFPSFGDLYFISWFLQSYISSPNEGTSLLKAALPKYVLGYADFVYSGSCTDSTYLQLLSQRSATYCCWNTDTVADYPTATNIPSVATAAPAGLFQVASTLVTPATDVTLKLTNVSPEAVLVVYAYYFAELNPAFGATYAAQI